MQAIKHATITINCLGSLEIESNVSALSNEMIYFVFNFLIKS